MVPLVAKGAYRLIHPLFAQHIRLQGEVAVGIGTHGDAVVASVQNPLVGLFRELGVCLIPEL